MSLSVNITSGKGGVGKSAITANMGAALAMRGFSVVIIDADIGLRAQDTLLGVENSVVFDLIDVTKKDCTIDQALIECPSVHGLHLLPAAQFARVRSLESDRLKELLKHLKHTYNYILIDSPAGIEKGFRNIVNAGTDRTILVVTPDDICIRDAERVCQIYDAKHLPRPEIVVNRLNNDLIYHHEMLSAKIIADTLDLSLLGEIPEDSFVYRSLLKHDLFIHYDCEARRAVLRIVDRFLGLQSPFPEIGTTRPSFFRQLFSRVIKEVTPIDNY